MESKELDLVLYFMLYFFITRACPPLHLPLLVSREECYGFNGFWDVLCALCFYSAQNRWFLEARSLSRQSVSQTHVTIIMKCEDPRIDFDAAAAAAVHTHHEKNLRALSRFSSSSLGLFLITLKFRKKILADPASHSPFAA